MTDGVVLAAKTLMKNRNYHQALKMCELGLSQTPLTDRLHQEYLATILESLKLLVEDHIGGKADRKGLERAKYLRVMH